MCLSPLKSGNQDVICESKNTILKSRFVEKFNELKEEGKIEEEKLFEETGKALLAIGMVLQRRGTDKVSVKYSYGVTWPVDPEHFTSRPSVLRWSELNSQQESRA